MNIVITMAGAGSRFRKAGYKQPKYMIEVNGKTLFEWSMLSLSDYFDDKSSKFIFIAREENNSRSYVEENCKKLGISNVSVVELKEPTDGQATSAMLAEPYWNEEDELIVYNIDTYVEEGYLTKDRISGDGFIPCFNAPGDHWSFVKLDDDGHAIEVREKQRISDNCTIGLYYFKSAKLYAEIYEKYYQDGVNIEMNEKYIAPLYNFMIKNGYTVDIDLVSQEKVHILGTPEEVEAFNRRK